LGELLEHVSALIAFRDLPQKRLSFFICLEILDPPREFDNS
jgi:hypothetical protein